MNILVGIILYNNKTHSSIKITVYENNGKLNTKKLLYTAYTSLYYAVCLYACLNII